MLCGIYGIKSKYNELQSNFTDFICIYVEEVTLFFYKGSIKIFNVFYLFKLELSIKYLS